MGGPRPRNVQKKITKKVTHKNSQKQPKKKPNQGKKQISKETKPLKDISVSDQRKWKALKAKESKKIWETLRRRKLDPTERQSQVEKVLNLWKGNLKKACLRPDTCRVIQSVIKYGSEQQRAFLVTSLLGDVIELAKDRYGHFILLKIFRYCTKEQIDEVVSAFRGQLVSLMKNSYSSDVVDFLYQAVANTQQKRILLHEMYCGNERRIIASLGDSLKDVSCLKSFLAKIGIEFRESTLNSIVSLLESLCNNSKLMRSALIHRLAKECFDELNEKMRKTLASSLISHGAVMLHTREGSQVVIECIKLADAKEKKQLAKSLKADIVKVAMDEYGHRVLLALINYTDDTAMLENVLFRDIIRNATILFCNKHGRLPILHLLSPCSKRYFNPCAYSFLTDSNENTLVKKDFETRRIELLSLIRHSLEDVLQKHLHYFVCNAFSYVIVLEFVLHIFRNDENILSWLEAIENVYCVQLENKLQGSDSNSKSDADVSSETRFPARILRIICKTVDSNEVYHLVSDRLGKYKDSVQDVEERRLASLLESFSQSGTQREGPNEEEELSLE